MSFLTCFGFGKKTYSLEDLEAKVGVHPLSEKDKTDADELLDHLSRVIADEIVLGLPSCRPNLARPAPNYCPRS